MGYNVPTLSASGWEKGIKEKADRVFSYFLVSQYSQSEIYYGKVSSLPYLIKTFGDDPETLASEARNALTQLFTGYFDSVEVDVQVQEQSQSEARLDIRFSAILTENLVKYSLGRLLSIENSVVSKIVKFEQ